MKKFLLLSIAALVGFAANAWTVKFTNPDNWAKVNAYVWDAAGKNALGGWPGTAMTKDGDVWTISSDADEPTNIIFNNGSGSQTTDLKFVADATYDKNGVLGAELNEYEIFFDNSKTNWSQVYVYTFSPVLNGGWPGEQMTLDSATGLYKIVIKAESFPTSGKIIFNNNAGSQTGNLDLIEGTTYDVDGPVGAELTEYKVYFDNTNSNWEKVYIYSWQPEAFGAYPGTELTQNADGLYEAVYESSAAPSFGGILFSNGEGVKTEDLTFEDGKTYSMPKIDEFPDLYIRGEVNDWEAVEAYMMTREDNVYSIHLTDGISGEWKIADSTWNYNFGAGGDGIEANKDCDCWFGSSLNFTVGTVETPTLITLTVVEGSAVANSEIASTILVNTQVNVKNIAVDNTEAVYFNLQGVRVANPEKGMFIKVQGNKAVKVAL